MKKLAAKQVEITVSICVFSGVLLSVEILITLYAITKRLGITRWYITLISSVCGDIVFLNIPRVILLKSKCVLCDI